MHRRAGRLRGRRGLTVEVPRPPKPAPPIVGGPSTRVGTLQTSSASDDKTATDDTDRAKGKSADDEGGESGAEADTTAPGAGDPASDATADPNVGSASADPTSVSTEGAARPTVDPGVVSGKPSPPATPRASFSAGWPRPAPAACLPVSVAVGARRCRRSPRWQGCRAASAAGSSEPPGDGLPGGSGPG